MNNLQNYLFVTVLSLLIMLPARAEIIELGNGDILQVEIVSETETDISVKHPSLGELTIARVQIATIRSDQHKHEEKSVAEAESVDRGLLGTGLMQDWQRNLSVGLNGASGNSDNTNFRAGFKGGYQNEESRWALNLRYIFAQDDNEVSDDNVRADLSKDWLTVGSRKFYFGSGGFDWDEFKDWKYRIRGYGGIGYIFVDSDELSFDNRLGLGGNQTFAGNKSKDETTLEGLYGVKLKWVISEKQTFEFDNTFYPNLTNTGEYRNVTNIDWLHKLDYYRGLGIKLGFNNEYDTTETDKNDFNYYLTLQWAL